VSIQDNELPFRELVDAAPDGLVVCEQTGGILLANAEAERMFGYAPGELIGKPIEILVPNAVRGRHGQHVANFTGAPKLRPMGILADVAPTLLELAGLPRSSGMDGVSLLA
jgi:PAS domain S-box-containing protein